jgi:predicted porin
MKLNSLLISLVAACGGSAFADYALVNTGSSTLAVFGTIDVAYGTVSNSLPPNQYSPTSIMPWVTSGIKDYGSVSGRQTDFFNGGLSTSNVGIKGSTEIESGSKLFFKFDSALNPISMKLTSQAHAEAMNGGLKTPTTAYATSSLNGEIFARETYFGISNPKWGNLTIGRNNNFILDVMNNYAPLHKANLLTPFGNGVLGGGGGISENARLENSFKYTNNIDNYNYGFEYTSGNGGGTLLGLGRSGQYGGKGGAINIGYSDAMFSAQLVGESFKSVLKTAPASALTTGNNPLHYNSISLTAYDQNAALLALKYHPNDKIAFQAGFEHMRLSSADSNLSSITSIYNESVAAGGVSNYSGSEQNFTVKYVGSDYNFSSDWNAGISLARVKMGTWTSFLGGDLNSHTILVTNHYNKETDIYAGAMNTKYSGLAFATNYINSETVYAIGLRYKF